MIRLITVLVVSGVFGVCLATGPHPARLIRIDVIVDGKTILRGSTSDGGRQNVDDVWRSVVNGVRKRSYSTTLYPTEDFKPAMLVHTGGESYTLKAKERRAKVLVHVHHGGRASVSELKLTKVEDTRRLGGEERVRNWCLDADQLKQLFSARLISRKQAADIDNIGNMKF